MTSHHPSSPRATVSLGTSLLESSEAQKRKPRKQRTPTLSSKRGRLDYERKKHFTLYLVLQFRHFTISDVKIHVNNCVSSFSAEGVQVSQTWGVVLDVRAEFLSLPQPCSSPITIPTNSSSLPLHLKIKVEGP